MTTERLITMENTALPTVQPVYEFEGCSLSGYVARGHHAPDSFVAAIIHDYDPEVPPTTEQVQQTWWRNVPQGDGMIVVNAESDTDKRGAYKVTWWPTE
jgi:hypothetical protein